VLRALCFPALVQSDSAGVECRYSSADKNSTEVAAVCCGSETVSTGFVSHSELTPSWNRFDSLSSCASKLYSRASSASSIEVIAGDPTTAEAFDDQLSRTVEILNVREDLRDEIELYVEHKKHGGGEFQTSEYDSKHRRLTVIFVDAKGSSVHFL